MTDTTTEQPAADKQKEPALPKPAASTVTGATPVPVLGGGRGYVANAQGSGEVQGINDPYT